MTVRVLVTCSRSWSAWAVMRTALERVHREHPDAVLVHGDAPKGDRDAAGLWRNIAGPDAQVEAWPADWANCDQNCRHVRKGKHCLYAGYRRNTAMVESAPDLVLAFINNRSKGASHCAQLADDAGIPVVRYEQATPC